MFILELHEIGPINYVSDNSVRFLSQLEETSVQPDGHINEFGIVRVNGQRSPESFHLESTMADQRRKWETGHSFVDGRGTTQRFKFGRLNF